ncbi:hypothetical protein OPT61_g6563 [Boeremia exigua]|uniref:Uncharacterized protein n=1 Tax=Boeremia exigua TaxID=749465 RepID=A0ACC2I5K8_9PLEO|nr:hypothetical protein OPT61_g6563 [Boeremia exigua]
MVPMHKWVTAVIDRLMGLQSFLVTHIDLSRGVSPDRRLSLYRRLSPERGLLSLTLPNDPSRRLLTNQQTDYCMVTVLILPPIDSLALAAQPMARGSLALASQPTQAGARLLVIEESHQRGALFATSSAVVLSTRSNSAVYCVYPQRCGNGKQRQVNTIRILPFAMRWLYALHEMAEMVRGDVDEDFICRWRAAVQQQLIEPDDARSPLMHGVLTAPLKPIRSSALSKVSESKPKSKPKKGQRRAHEDSSDNDSYEPEQDSDDKEEGEDEEGEHGELEQADKIQQTGPVTSKMLPLSLHGLAFKLPLGYRQCTTAEILEDFCNDLAEPVQLAARGASNLIPTLQV